MPEITFRLGQGTIEEGQTMGRILFLSAVAFIAYKYIARSNQRHQQLPSADASAELLPPASSQSSPAPTLSAVEPDRPVRELAVVSSAVEPDPSR